MIAQKKWDERIKQAEYRRQTRHDSLVTGGGDGHNGDMENRIAALESDAKDIKKDLVDLKVSVAAVSAKVDIIVSKMPSWWQAPVGAGSLLALLGAMLGIAKALNWI